VGFNYRMTNIQAAIGLAQLERVDWLIERRREVAAQYRSRLCSSALTLPQEAAWARNVYWLYSVLVPADVDRDGVMADMARAGIETRPFFVPLHALPPYREPDGDQRYPVSTALGARGISLPSSASLTEDQMACICRSLLASLAARAA
jgi:perosamine synthetase